MFQDIDDYSKEVQCLNHERLPTCGTYVSDMKVFQRIVLRYLKNVTAGIMDLFQFAYQTNRSVDDAVALALHYITC